MPSTGSDRGATGRRCAKSDHGHAASDQGERGADEQRAASAVDECRECGKFGQPAGGRGDGLAQAAEHERRQLSCLRLCRGGSRGMCVCQSARVMVAAIEPSTAMPSAPPTWRDALITLEAMPDCSGWTAAIPAAATAGIARPMPRRVGAPVIVDGRVWGVVSTAGRRRSRRPPWRPRCGARRRWGAGTRHLPGPTVMARPSQAPARRPRHPHSSRRDAMGTACRLPFVCLRK